MLNGILSSARIPIGYIYMMEFIPARLHAKFGTIRSMIDVSLLLVIVLYFKYSKAKDWVIISLPGLAIAIIGCVVNIFFIPESPKFLINQRRYEEAEKAL
jgi:MFS family permease